MVLRHKHQLGFVSKAPIFRLNNAQTVKEPSCNSPTNFAFLLLLLMKHVLLHWVWINFCQKKSCKLVAQLHEAALFVFEEKSLWGAKNFWQLDPMNEERGEAVPALFISSLMYLFRAQIESESFLSLHCFIHKSSQSSLVLRDPDEPPVVVSSEVVGRILRNRTSRVTKSLHLQRNYLCQGIEYWTLEYNSNRY